MEIPYNDCNENKHIIKDFEISSFATLLLEMNFQSCHSTNLMTSVKIYAHRIQVNSKSGTIIIMEVAPLQ